MKFDRQILALVFGFALVTPGCAKLAHLQELLTLKGYADEKAAQKVFIQSQDQKFAQLLAAVKEGSIGEYAYSKNYRKTFGEPVYKRVLQKGGVNYEEWLYRQAVAYSDSDKVYLHFDSQGKLLSWEYIASAKKGEGHHGQDSQTPCNEDHCGTAQ